MSPLIPASADVIPIRGSARLNIIEPTITTIPAMLSRITATSPAIVTKTFALLPEGFGPGATMRLHKGTCADVYEGTVERLRIGSLAAFADLLTSLGTNNCLTYGAPALPKVALTTQKNWTAMGQPPSHVARTKQAFSWTATPGIFMLDYDAPKDGTAPFDREELVAAVRAACPALADVSMLWWPSTSSCVVNSETGEEMTGVRGQRLYLLVREASDVERAGKALLTHLWAAGHGRFGVSKAGAALEYGLFDQKVFESNRIDFAAGALCHAPLEQRRGAPVIIAGAVEFVDTRSAIPTPTAAIIAAADAKKAEARALVKPEAAKVREAWVGERVAELMTNNTTLTEADARASAVRAVENGTLPGDWPLVVDGEAVTVGDVLDHPARFHGKQTLDPVEPDYDGGRAVGKLFLYGTRPNLYSFAHGGTNYRLERQPARIYDARGRYRELTDEVLARMRRESDVFDFAELLVSVDDDGETRRFNDAMLRYWLGGLVKFYTIKKGVELDVDVPGILPRDILGLGSARGLRALTAVITAPTLRPDGTVFDQPGYDAATGFLLELGDAEPMPVPDRPTREQAAAALAALWLPFDKFPFVGPLDRAAHLAALLTAVVRPSLPTAPAFGYGAPTFGSGKTLAARCVGVVASGSAPTMLALPTGRDDEEMRKVLTATLIEGPRAAVFDNVMGPFNSGTFAKVLTSAEHTDRPLGTSTTITVPVKTMFLLTGNNLTLAGDLPRRVIVSRIDPCMEAPFARSFELDPERYCLANRQMLVAAALTLLRFYLSAGVARPGKGRMASFEAWDDLVRQTVLYVDRELAPGQFGDVMELVTSAQSNDPEHEAWRHMLRALRARFSDWFTASEVATVFNATPFGAVPLADAAVREALLEYAAGRAVLSSGTIGKVLQNRADSIAGGLRLVTGRDARSNTRRFRVEGEAEGLAKVVDARPWIVARKAG